VQLKHAALVARALEGTQLEDVALQMAPSLARRAAFLGQLTASFSSAASCVAFQGS
jgi:hypothetical protein